MLDGTDKNTPSRAAIVTSLLASTNHKELFVVNFQGPDDLSNLELIAAKDWITAIRHHPNNQMEEEAWEEWIDAIFHTQEPEFTPENVDRLKQEMYDVDCDMDILKLW